MGKVIMNVKLLEMSQNAISLIYVAYYALLSFFPKIGQVEPA